jgi:hypothetical protein
MLSTPGCRIRLILLLGSLANSGATVVLIVPRFAGMKLAVVLDLLMLRP